MVTNLTATKNPDRQIAHSKVLDSVRVIVQKVLIVTVLAMIASLPVAGAISGADTVRSFGALTARLGRPEAVYSLSHLPQTTEGLFGKRRKHQRNRVSHSFLRLQRSCGAVGAMKQRGLPSLLV